MHNGAIFLESVRTPPPNYVAIRTTNFPSSTLTPLLFLCIHRKATHNTMQYISVNVANTAISYIHVHSSVFKHRLGWAIFNRTGAMVLIWTAFPVHERAAKGGTAFWAPLTTLTLLTTN